MDSWYRLILLAPFIAFIVSCGSAPDPYADPGTPPPAPITDPTVATSGVVSPRSDTGDLIEVNVAGFANSSTGAPVNDLTTDDFVVVEDGVVQGIVVEKIGDTNIAQADIAFVFDTTGSMGSALTSVQNSIIAFTDFLGTTGLDVQVGAVTFGDAYDVKFLSSSSPGTSFQELAPPSFDGFERPSFPLTNDVSAFGEFIEAQSPRGGSDAPENALGALEFAYDTLNWRTGAQKIIIVITDVCSHTAGSSSRITDPWSPGTPEEILAKLAGNTTVHVVNPDQNCAGSVLNMNYFTGAEGTGGVFFDWDGSEFDLSSLPIAAVVGGGYTVTYRGDLSGEEHTVRVVIDNNDDVRGEFTVEATY